VQLAVGARTDVGMVRSGNEDNYHAEASATHGLFIVADGMGGHAAGEVASEMAVHIVARDLAETSLAPEETRKAEIGRALQHANGEIYERTLSEDDKQGMGTTASVLMLAQGRYVIGQIGDSRVYLMRDATLYQLTKDHSYVQEQVDAGRLTPEQARSHPYSNVITRCVGAQESVEADVSSGDLRTGDVYLVASDGLTGMVDDRRLHHLLQSKATPQRLAEALIAEANGRGGMDNITAIVVRVVSLEDPAGPDASSEERPQGSPENG
jgi:protein phosphatase